MNDKKTISISSDPAFLEELSEFLDVLSNPVRLRILKFIEQEPKEVNEIAEHMQMSYQNTKKHLDKLVITSLVVRGAGFGRETDRGIAPVWKYSLAPEAMDTLVKTLGIFSSIAVPLGYNDIRQRITELRSAMFHAGSGNGPVLYLISGRSEGQAFLLKQDRIPLGRDDADNPPALPEGAVVLPEQYMAVTRVAKPHAFISRTRDMWQIEDNASTGGTYLNAQRISPHRKMPLANGDVIDLSVGQNAARFLFVAGV